jgi:hypothetical protein
MSSIVLLVTDRPAFEQTWQFALSQAGILTQTVNPDGLGERHRDS